MAEHGKKPPSNVVDYLTEYGGKNLYGEPMFRIVWGGDRLTTRMGKWEDRNDNGDLIQEVVEARKTPKYKMAVNRWVVEVWVPPSYYGTPEQWAATTHEYVDGLPVEVLGEYPKRGDYELIDIVEDLVCECGRVSGSICDSCNTSSRYLEPTRDYVKYLVDAYAYAKVHMEAIAEQVISRSQKETDGQADKYLEMIKDNAPVNAGLPTVSYAGLDWGKNASV